MKNKKGFLLAEETLKMVLAVICIGFLIAFLFALYFNNVNNAKFLQAESVLKSNSEGSIKTAIETLKESNIILAEDTRRTSTLLHHYNIKGKQLISFNDKNKERKTQSVITELKQNKQIYHTLA